MCDYSNCYCVVCISTEDASSTIYGITDARIAYCSKIYERLMFVNYILYVSVPGIVEFLSSQGETTTDVHLDVGFFNDL